MVELKNKNSNNQSKTHYIDYLIHELILYLAHKPNFDCQNKIFMFSLLEEPVYFGSENDFDNNKLNVLAKVDLSYNPTFKMKPFTVKHGLIKFKRFGKVKNYTIHELDVLGFPIFDKDNAISIWLSIYTHLYKTIEHYALKAQNVNVIEPVVNSDDARETLQYQLKPSYINENIQSFRSQFKSESNFLPLPQITQEMSLAMAHTNPNDWIKSFDEFYSVLYAQEETYNWLNDNPDLEDNVIRLTHLIFRDELFSNWLRSRKAHIKSADESQISLNSETVTSLLSAKSRSFQKYVSRRYQNLSNVVINLNNNVVLTADWIRFISVFQHAKGRFNLANPEALKAELTHVNSLLELFKHSIFCTVSEKPEYEAYHMFEFRDMVTKLEKLDVDTYDKFSHIVINRYARGQFYSLSDIRLLEKYKIHLFEKAPLTLYRAHARKNELITLQNLCTNE